jgi:hypothetical protein
MLLRKLQEWLSLIPSSQEGSAGSPELSTCVHFAYLLLEVFIFRALLRPMVPNKPPPRLIDENEQIPLFSELTVDDYIAQIIGDENVAEDIPATIATDDDKSIPIILNAAETCAANMLRLISRIESTEMGSFWYSCSSALPQSLIARIANNICRVSHRLCDGQQLHAPPTYPGT